MSFQHVAADEHGDEGHRHFEQLGLDEDVTREKAPFVKMRPLRELLARYSR